MKRLKSIIILVILVFFVGIFLTGCGNSEKQTKNVTTGDDVTPIIIRLAHGSAPIHPWHIAAQKFAETVTQKTDGQVKFELYTAGQMGSDREMAEALQNNTLQMSIISTMAMSAFEPSLQIFDFPYLFPDYESAYKVLDGEIGQKIGEKLLPKDMRVLVYLENDYRNFSNNNKPIEQVDDLRGLKIRVPETPILIEWLKDIGAAPTPIAYNELYSSLQTKVVDGQDNGVLLTYTAKYYEVQDYYSLTKHIYAPAPLLINETFWQSLPQDIQKIIQEAAVEMREYQRELDRENSAKFLKEMETAGLTVNEISPENLKGFVKSTESVYRKFQEKVDNDILNQILAETRK